MSPPVWIGSSAQCVATECQSIVLTKVPAAGAVPYRPRTISLFFKDDHSKIMRPVVDPAERVRDKMVDSAYLATMNKIQRIPVIDLTPWDRTDNFNAFDVSCKARQKVWVFSDYSMSPNAQAVNSLRIVGRANIHWAVAEQLALDVILAWGYLKENAETAIPAYRSIHMRHRKIGKVWAGTRNRPGPARAESEFGSPASASSCDRRTPLCCRLAARPPGPVRHPPGPDN